MGTRKNKPRAKSSVGKDVAKIRGKGQKQKAKLRGLKSKLSKARGITVGR